MDKNILRKFAIESRQELMEKISNKIKTLYIDEEFELEQNGENYILINNNHRLVFNKEEYNNRQLLIARIKEVTLNRVIEESAYTWFNRIIAIRYMEIHDLIPLTKNNQSLGIRVLSSKDNMPDPEIMKISNLLNSELDIEFNKEHYVNIQDINKRFEYILLLVCKKLRNVIPQVFGGINDYIDVLIPDNLLNESGYITKLLKDVPIDNFNQVEIIGWLYQYYISEKKDIVFENLKKNIKINKYSIPAATQLFTPDWIVKYMVENSLGKYWIEHGGDKKLIDKWKYYIKSEKLQIKEKINPEEIKCIDPCCGSGHILVYMFEVLFQIYESYGYSKKDIAELILKNNLYGLDIDDRAGQLSILSLLLKAREYDKDIFNKNIVRSLNVISIQESSKMNKSDLDILRDEEESDVNETISYLYNIFQNAKEIGSLLFIENRDYEKVFNVIENVTNRQVELFDLEKIVDIKEKYIPLLTITKILNNKYDIVVTNPPYIGSKGLSDALRDYLATYYQDGKYDTYSSFILKCIELCKNTGKIGMMTPNTWMFISSYKNLRLKLINYNINSLLHLSSKAFMDAAVIITSFILSKDTTNNNFMFINLQEYDSENLKESFSDCLVNNIVSVNKERFKKIPNNTFTYWMSDKFINNLSIGKKIGEKIISDGQNKTGDNDKYLRNIWEVNKNNISPDKRWNIHAKGGEYRKWFGNLDTVIDWSDKARNFYKKNKVARITPKYLWFKKGITWTLLSGLNNSFRLLPEYCTFNCVGPAIFLKNDAEYNLILGLLNSKVAKLYINGFNPTLSLTIGDISNVPVLNYEKKLEKINKLVDNNICISKEDWDSFETSWEFRKHPLVEYKPKGNAKIEDIFESWKCVCDEKFNLLKQNEEELNKIFIDMYGLQNELKPDIEEKDVTVRKANREREIKSLISYAVGCMFGRYSLDEDGLIFAGGEFEKSRYKTFEVDLDNIIPIMEESFFTNDIVIKFKKFIEIVYGKATLYENLDYIAETLGRRNGENSEDTIRRYFINDFYNNHIKIYQKRPIYWLFDSGKKNGFKCLIYIHRYNEGTVAKIRLDYLHRIQNIYEKQLIEINEKLSQDISIIEKKSLTKKQLDYSAKLEETNEYDEKIAYIADEKINIDLDDGVLVNYSKFTVKNPKTMKETSVLANSKDIIKKKKEK